MSRWCCGPNRYQLYVHSFVVERYPLPQKRGRLRPPDLSDQSSSPQLHSCKEGNWHWSSATCQRSLCGRNVNKEALLTLRYSHISLSKCNRPAKKKTIVTSQDTWSVRVQSQKCKQKLTASSPEMARSLSVPAATTPPSLLLEPPLLLFFSLNLWVGNAFIDSVVAPRGWVKSSLYPRIEIMHGKQQHIVVQRMKGMA